MPSKTTRKARGTKTTQQSLEHDRPSTARYKKRLLALVDGPIQRWKKQLAANSATKDEPLAKLLDEFERFARHYFEHFIGGNPLTTLPQDLSSALRRLQLEMATINRAIEQRDQQEFAPSLAKADQRAKALYQRFLGYKGQDPNPAMPITYFEKLYAISRAPYTPYPLISIPLLDANGEEQWDEGLAHELGHYIFWNSSSLDKYIESQAELQNAVLRALEISTDTYSLFQERVKIAEIWINWLEETFADICGTLLIGPNYAFSSQQRIVESDEDPIGDDGEHPAPYLRPLISIEVLRWVAEQITDSYQQTKLSEIIATLEENWAGQRKLGQAGTHSESGLEMSKIDERVKDVVRAILGDDKATESHGTWVSADGETSQNLGQLIDYSPWLKTLSDKPSITLTTLSKGPDPLPGSPSFDELLKYLKAKFKDDEKEVRRALLLLELQERGQGCRSFPGQKFKDVGTGGRYNKC